MNKRTHRGRANVGRTCLMVSLLAGATTLGTGCESAGEGAVSGGAIGALGGLAIGSLSGDAGAGAAIGAISGAVAGGVIGDQNKRAADRQQQMRYQDGGSR